MMPDTAIKDDADKVPVDMLPTEALIEIAKVLGFGARKYGRDNWRYGMCWTRVYGALLRHMFAWHQREDRDDESGFLHLAHAACCVLFLLVYAVCGLGTDDRPKTNVAQQELPF
jgi:hypothetical protein